MEVYNRELVPTHCIFEVTEFSLKGAEQGETHQSEIFEAGGCKWSLSLYPNGNKKRGGENHISLYLNIEDTHNDFTSGWEVLINYRLFIYDQINDCYLTIQDVKGAVRRFHNRKKQWGFDQLLSLESLRKSSNGYLLDDTCIFGAEVLVVKASTGKLQPKPSSPTIIQPPQSDDSNNSIPSSGQENNSTPSSTVEKSSTPDNEADKNEEVTPDFPSTTDGSYQQSQLEKSSTLVNEDDKNEEVTPDFPSTADGTCQQSQPEKSYTPVNENDKNEEVTPNFPSTADGTCQQSRPEKSYTPVNEDDKNEEVTPNFPSTTDGVEVYERGQPPSHYTLKIDNFSLLQENTYPSDIFESGGYKWSLILHPNGNKEEGGEDHISLYLKFEDQNSVSPGWEVFVNYRFFVHNQKKGCYLTIQDAQSGRAVRFHENKKKSGFTKLLSLENFIQSSNGYLVNDSCLLGAEVFVMKPTGKHGFLSMTQLQPTYNKFTFLLGNFSERAPIFYDSPVADYGVTKWRIRVYPKNFMDTGTFVGVFLFLEGAKDLPPGVSVTATFMLRILDHGGPNHKQAQFTHTWSRSAVEPIGYAKFSYLFDFQGARQKTWIQNDTMIVEAEFYTP